MLGVSAAQALLRRQGQTRLQTSSQRLDDAFLGMTKAGNGRRNGIARGTVGEIVGPPGVGKTTLALQIAVNAIKHGESVIWIDTSSIFPLPRLKSILSVSNQESSRDTSLLSRFHSLSIRSLPSLLALLLHSAHTESSLFVKTPNLSLVVIDDLSTPILANYPGGFEEENARLKSGRKDHADSPATKRTNILNELAYKLASLAVKHNIAIVVLNQLSTKVVSGNNASLVPALGDAWTSVCSYRIILYRQLIPPNFCERAQDVRFAHFQKCEGIVVKNEDIKNVPFLVTDSGIEDVIMPEDETERKHELSDDDARGNPVKRKRVLSVAKDNVDDSEGEETDFLTEIDDAAILDK